MIYETIITREQSDRYRAAGWWPDRLLSDYLADAVRQASEKVAFVDARRRMTYAELSEQADRCALAFLAAGVRRGDAVTLQLPNWIEFVIVALGLERIGAVVSPVAPIFRERELRAMLRLSRSVAAVVPAGFRGHDHAAMFRRLQTETPALKTVIVVDGVSGDGLLGWDEFLAGGDALLPHRQMLDLLRPQTDEVCEIMFTSGTTGEPKGVMHTPNTLAGVVQAAIAGQGMRADDVLHMASTLGHQTGFLYGLRQTIQLGATCVLQDVWDAAAFVDLIERERVSFTMGATPFLADTLRVPDLDRRDLASLRLFVCGGAPIPQPLAEEAGRRLPCRLVPIWGMTENGAATAVMAGDPVAKITISDGRPYLGLEVAVRDGEGGELPSGSEGDLVVRGAYNFAGYSQGRRFTEQFFDADGWFATGDRAVRDTDGFIRISGRTKDIIIRGGENVPVKEIEDVLLRHPKVRNAAIVGLPDDRLGEIGCACLILEPEAALTLDDLRSFLAAQQVTRQFWPERLALVAEFPFTPSGKIQKYKLREALAAELAAVDQ